MIAFVLTSAAAQRASAQQASPPPVDVDGNPPSTPEPTPEPEYEASAPTADLAGHRERELRTRLEHALREEQDASLLLPSITTSVGAAMVLTGVAISVGLLAGCDEDSCTGPFWPTWLMMGGALIGSAGAAWVVLESHDQAELRSRRYQIERELEYLKWNQRTGTTPGPQAALRFRSSFD